MFQPLSLGQFLILGHLHTQTVNVFDRSPNGMFNCSCRPIALSCAFDMKYLLQRNYNRKIIHQIYSSYRQNRKQPNTYLPIRFV